MKGQIIGSVTSYLADLTTKLTNLVKTENLHTLSSHSLLSHDNHSLIDPRYRKLQQWNYLQYFDYLLRFDTTHPIRLDKKKEPFCLKEDLEILKAVSSNPNKVIVKSLEQLATNKNVYKSNFRNVFVKRNFKQLKERHQFLKAGVKEAQLKHITSWLQVNGLQTKAYLMATTEEEFQRTGLRIKVSKLCLAEQGIKMQIAKGKRVHAQKQNQSEGEDKQFENLVSNKASRKKVHTQTQGLIPKCIDFNSIFQTPHVKTIQQQVLHNAPKKIKEQQSAQEEQVKATPKKQRKVFRVLDVKKDVVIKQESDEQIGQERVGRSQPKRHFPVISQFRLFPDRQQSKLNPHIADPSTKQQQNLRQLQAIVQSFRTHQNMSQVRILKIMDQVSGDLADLKSYLKTQDRKLLWKRLQDAVLRNYIKNTGKSMPMAGKRQLTVEMLYQKLVRDKGDDRVKRRVKYLKLEERPKQ